MLQLVEVDRYDAAAAVGKLDGLDVVVADAASLVGKRVKVRVERVLDGRAYAVLVRKTKEAPEPLTAEGEAEKPTRKPPARKAAAVAKDAEPAEAEEPTEEAPEAAEEAPEVLDESGRASAASPPALAAKKKTRRGSRGGRKRKKPATPQTAETAEAEPEAEGAAEETPEPSRAVTIHVPGDDLGREGAAEPAEPEIAEPEAADEPVTAEAEAEEAPKPKKKTRRGSRGGKNRKKKPATAATNGAEASETSEQPQEEPQPSNGDFEYVPMSEWGDELDRNR
jgi:ribonuclease E